MTAPITLLKAADTSNAECVKFLENMLQRARDGEIVHVAVVAQNVDRSTSTGWSSSEGVYRTSMLGAIETLKLEYYAKVVVE